MPTERKRAKRRIVQQAPLLVALVLLWMLLWGNLSLLNLVTGVLLALLVTRIFYLPPVELSGRFNPFWFLAFLLRFLGELVFASFQVAFQALGPRGAKHNAVIAVQLRTRSDFLLTLTAISLSVIPGSLVVEVERERSVLYLHVFNTRSTADLDSARDKALDVEMRLVRALGSTDDVRRMKA
ncbi:MAG: Na+/H+ antiporter subunit [Glaciihabitans sp.]|nr:Na+/H+ antiporter subunit [Glaciihabitans sp.]